MMILFNVSPLVACLHSINFQSCVLLTSFTRTICSFELVLIAVRSIDLDIKYPFVFTKKWPYC